MWTPLSFEWSHFQVSLDSSGFRGFLGSVKFAIGSERVKKASILSYTSFLSKQVIKANNIGRTKCKIDSMYVIIITIIVKTQQEKQHGLGAPLSAKSFLIYFLIVLILWGTGRLFCQEEEEEGGAGGNCHGGVQSNLTFSFQPSPYSNANLNDQFLGIQRYVTPGPIILKTVILVYCILNKKSLRFLKIGGLLLKIIYGYNKKNLG